MSSFQTEHHAALVERMFRRAFLRAHACLNGTLALIAIWRRRAAARRELKALCDLDDSLLRDIGVTRTELWCEAMQPFWRASSLPAARTHRAPVGDVEPTLQLEDQVHAPGVSAS